MSEFNEYRHDGGIKVPWSGKACPHLEHAMMASEDMSRVCQSCQIKALEEKIASLETELKEWKVKCAFLEKRVKELDGVVERTQPFIDHELMMRKVFEEKAKSLTARIAEMSEALKQVVECGAGCEHCYIYAKDALSKSRPTNQNKVKP